MTLPCPIALTTTQGAVRIPIRVLPRSSRTQVGGVREGRLIIRVTAAPVDSAANDAAVTALARALDVPSRDLSLAAGASSRNKLIAVRGLAIDQIEARVRRLSSNQSD
jgi:uncharacterized protein YggU (UPF0235/DUF167 family)